MFTQATRPKKLSRQNERVDDLLSCFFGQSGCQKVVNSPLQAAFLPGLGEVLGTKF